MSTHVLLKPGKIRSDGLHDASEHRAHLSPAYNYYVRTLANLAFDSRSKREIMLLRQQSGFVLLSDRLYALGSPVVGHCRGYKTDAVLRARPDSQASTRMGGWRI
jgi:hypothetical protein